MTVEPGKGGQTLISDMVNKVQTLKDYINENNLDTVIEVDGGINKDTIDMASVADMVVSGSYVCESTDYEKAIESLRN